MTEQEIIKQFVDAGLIDASYNPDDDWYIDVDKCYCDCTDCKAWADAHGVPIDCNRYQPPKEE